MKSPQPFNLPYHIHISMHIRHLIITTLALLCAAMPSTAKKGGRNYYIDPATGNDAADGRSVKTAWRTLAPTKALILQAGDSLLLRRGTILHGLLEISAAGKPGRPAVISAYGNGAKPCIAATDSSLYAIHVSNSDHLILQDLEVTNTGSQRMANRTGIKVSCVDFGVSHGIVLRRLYVHDVNGSLIKQAGGGSGLLFVNGGRKTVSTFDGLLVENCVIRRCERNGMIWSAYADRNNWHPNRHVTVRRNLIEEVPGDGIVPIGCDSALVEYNLMRDCPGTLPHSEAAAGFWPWSCDNTTMQFNEVSDHKAPWDAQGFDADYNCRNTTIRYNYSHDNDGGMVLICNSGTAPGAGNQGTRVAYNVSINDAIRPRATRSGIFSPSIHIAGPCHDTEIFRNIIHANPKSEPFIDRSLLTSDSWDGYADATTFRENIFYAPEQTEIRLNRSTGNVFDGNYYLGFFKTRPVDAHGHNASSYYAAVIASDPSGRRSLDFLFDKHVVGNGTAILRAVNPETITDFFEHMKAH